MPDPLTIPKFMIVALIGLFILAAYLFLYPLYLLRQNRRLRARVAELEAENGDLHLLNTNLRLQQNHPDYLLNRISAYRHIINRLLDDNTLNQQDSSWLKEEGL